LINLEPTLHAGEQVRWRRPAALSLEQRLITGTLYLTSEAVLFMPNRLNRRRDMVSTRLPFGSLKAVDTVAAQLALAAKRAGAGRRRLRVSTSSGAHLFVINHPEQVAGELRAALREWIEPA
jgi:hypothetical protein